MTDVQGLIYAYETESALGELTTHRTSASLPVGGRYRLIDFILSNMVSAGIRDVGVIMQRDYQSLLDHLGSGKAWDLSRRSGGLRLLPPFGLPDSHTGDYRGRMEALGAVESYVRDIRSETVLLAPGNLLANIDLGAAIDAHMRSGAAVTAVCSDGEPAQRCHRYFPDADGLSSKLLCSVDGENGGVASTEVYLIRRELLLEMIDRCHTQAKLHFHRDALLEWMAAGNRVNIYVHKGFARLIETVRDYYSANMELLQPKTQASVFPPSRPIRTKERADVSTYYGEESRVRNCMVADGCYIEGEIEDCVLFRGVHVEKGARLRGCIVMQDSVIGRDSLLRWVIVDKDARFGRGLTLSSRPELPLVVPKGSVLD